MKNDCKIVQDLLPTYIDKLTSNETIDYIEKHLNSCEKCKIIYDNMQQDLKKEEIDDIELGKNIKKYKKRICFIKLIFILIISVIIISVVGSITYKFYIIRKAYERNTNYHAFESFTLEEYLDSIEHYEKHYTTYYKDDIMKKYYGNDVVEYYDGENHYYFDNNNMTYWKSDIPVNTSLYIDISIIDGMENIVKNGKISNFEILKFIILKDDLRVIDYDFREKRYHVINCKSESILLDKDTFYAERIIQSGENYKYREPTEYRVRTANVGWREIQEPDFSKYKFIEK